MAAPVSMPINGRKNLSSDPTRNFRFLVTFQPYDSKGLAHLTNISFGFTSVSGLSMAVESIPYREGGMNTVLHQIPGQASFAPITLTRGVHLGNSQGWRWIKRLFSAINTGSDRTSPSFNFRSTVTIHVLQHPVDTFNESVGSPFPADDKQVYDVAAGSRRNSSWNDRIAVSYRAYNAWPTALAFSDLNAGDNAVLVEQLTLVHEGMDLFWNQDRSTGSTPANVPWTKTK